MANTKVVNELATEDAAEALHELGDNDFIDVIATLIKRRTANYNFYGNAMIICARIQGKVFEKS